MAETKGFDLSAALGDLSKLSAGSGQMQIAYIPYDQIRPDVANGYSMDGIEELAGNIETIGLLDPLVVRPEAFDRYMLVSGHRRHAAIGKIIQDGSQMFADGVPCIVKADEDGQDPEVVGLLHELRLLLANTDNRSKTSADQNREAEGTERIVARLAELGYPFPGRRRDWVSQLCGMSKSKLARLKVIRDNLEPSIKKGYYDKGKLKEDSAYKLAQLPPEVQRRTVDWLRAVRNAKPEYWYASTIEEYGKDVLRFEEYTCPKKYGGGPCSNKQNLQDKVWSGSYRSYPHCAYGKKCCADCDQLSSCARVCEHLKPKADELRAEKRAQNKAMKEAEKKAEQPFADRVRALWLRFGNALCRANMEDEDLRKITGHKIYQLGSDEITALECGEYAGKVKAGTVLPYFNSSYLSDMDRYIKTAEALDCSLDYLFLRTNVPEVNAGSTEPDTFPPQLGTFVDKHGRELTFDEIAQRVGKPIVMDMSTASREAFKVVMVKEIIPHEGGRRLIYSDGGRQPCAVDDRYFKPGCSHPSHAYELAAPQPAAPAKVTLDQLGWVTGEAPDGAKCWAKFMDEETTSDFSMLATWDAEGGVWYAGDRKSALSTIDQKCIGWWPIPDDNAPDLSDGPQPAAAAPADWCTGKPGKTGLYAVRLKASETAPGELSVFARWDGVQWRAEKSNKPIEGMIAIGWYPIPEVKR